MYDAMSKLDGEPVEKEVAGNVRSMHKTGKAFAQRGLQAYAANCDAIKAEIEEFQKVVPLLVVSTTSQADICTYLEARILNLFDCKSMESLT